MSRSDAFTLLEILVVMAILGILASAAYLQFASFSERWSLSRLADSVSNSIRAAGNIAESKGRPVQVQVDLDADTMGFVICKNRTNCNVNNGSHWKDEPVVEPIFAGSSAVFFQFVERDSGTNNTGGYHRFMITSQGRAIPNQGQNSTFYAIHLAKPPVPAVSERRKFRTVAIVPNSIQPRQYDYGRFDPFSSSAMH